MAIKNTKVRVMFTLLKSTEETLKALCKVYPNKSKSQLVDDAINCFATAVVEATAINMLKDKGGKKNVKEH